MKNFTQITYLLFFVALTVSAQQEKGIVGINNWLNNWTEFSANSVEYGEPNQIIAGNITQDITLSKKNTYMLMGSVFVTENATLTIEPGTVIIGDYDSKASLTITRGSKIVAIGEETDPIVFTSNRGVKRSGDWGGIIILGDAPSNKFGNGSVASYYPELDSSEYGFTNHGGENNYDSSGVLKYVRIEYAGKKAKSVGNFNGLLLASIGNQTILENIMVSYSAGNSFEVLGGEVIMENLVSYKSNGNDYKFNYGTQTKLYNALAVRSPYVSSRDGSRCLQILSYDKREEVDFTKKSTSVVAQNLTLINGSDNLESDIQKGLVKEAVFIGQNTSLDLNKSVISGFNPAVLFDDEIVINQENLENIKLTDMYFNNCNGNIFVEYNSNNDDLENWYGNRSFLNVYSKGNDSETFINTDTDKRPDFRLRINRIVASNDD
ncbi:MAG: hypothetical protein DA407_09000 [Bacteroidetes bacterium]|nr:MAG: hypothetical protein DA407_09000 [Bacteroidota bacterium]